jgi:hypothetical protein
MRMCTDIPRARTRPTTLLTRRQGLQSSMSLPIRTDLHLSSVVLVLRVVHGDWRCLNHTTHTRRAALHSSATARNCMHTSDACHRWSTHCPPRDRHDQGATAIPYPNAPMDRNAITRKGGLDVIRVKYGSCILSGEATPCAMKIAQSQFADTRMAIVFLASTSLKKAAQIGSAIITMFLPRSMYKQWLLTCGT